jgi:hypothetical protein
VVLVLFASLLAYSYIASYFNQITVVNSVEVEKTENSKTYFTVAFKYRTVAPKELYLAKGQSAVINCDLQPCIVKTTVEIVEAKLQNDKFIAVLDGKNIDNYSNILIRLADNATNDSTSVYVTVSNPVTVKPPEKSTQLQAEPQVKNNATDEISLFSYITFALPVVFFGYVIYAGIRVWVEGKKNKN